MTNKQHPDIEKATQALLKYIFSCHSTDAPIEANSISWILSKHLSISKEEEPKVCTACLGKKYVSVYSQEVGHDDFGGEGYVKKPEVKMLNCSRCEATGLEPVYKQEPTPEQQSDKPTKIEKIENNSLTKPITLLHKVNKLIDTINTQQKQIDYLLSKDK